MIGRAERPAGFLPFVGAAIARWRAADPEPPAQWVPPRGVGELNVLLDQVRAESGAAVLPPIQRDKDGYSLLLGREWSARAGARPAVGVLAVLLASESERIDRYPQYAWAIGEAALNAARAVQRKDETLEDALLRRVLGAVVGEGRFGAQGGRWASTRQQPTRRHMKLAALLWARALAGAAQILAHGATQWTDQDTQHLVHAAAVAAAEAAEERGDQVAAQKARLKAAQNPAPEVVMRRRYDAGAAWVGHLVDAVGETLIDPWKLTLLGPHGVDEGEAAAMLADGRRRWKRPV